MPRDTGETTLSRGAQTPFLHKTLDAVSSLSIGVKINLFLLGVGVLPPLAGLLVLHHAGSDVLLNSLDVNWGLSNDPSDKAMRRSGWYFAGSVAYQTPWVTPTLLGWYSTGDDDNIYNGSERMPVISGGLAGTSFGMDGGDIISMSGMLGTDNDYMGTWGVGLALADISFIEDLTHQLRAVFFGGTSHPHAMRDYRSAGDGINFSLNNPAGILLTTKDWGWELNFDHKYQMYENLAVYLESGLMDVYRKKRAWTDGVNNINDPLVKLWNTSTAWKLGIGLKYTF